MRGREAAPPGLRLGHGAEARSRRAALTGWLRLFDAFSAGRAARSFDRARGRGIDFPVTERRRVSRDVDLRQAVILRPSRQFITNNQRSEENCQGSDSQLSCSASGPVVQEVASLRSAGLHCEQYLCVSSLSGRDCRLASLCEGRQGIGGVHHRRCGKKVTPGRILLPPRAKLFGAGVYNDSTQFVTHSSDQ